MNAESASLSYFREIVTSRRRVDELADCPQQVVGTFCNFVPEELILAAGAVPVRLCSAETSQVAVGETFLPRDLCSVVKSTGGSVRSGSGLHGRADLLVMPTPCDGKKKLAALLREDKPVHILDLPPRKDSPGAREFWKAQIVALRGALEQLTSQRITRRRLRDAVALLNRRQAAFRRFLALRQADPPRISGQDALFVTQASFTDDIGRWTAQLEQLCDELEQTATNGPVRLPVRLLLTGAPLIWPNHKVIELLESEHSVVAADEMCSGGERLYQPTVLRDWSDRGIVDALAERYLLPCSCPCFADGSDRIHRILELVDTHRCDGVVYHSLRLCTLFEMEAHAVGAALKQRGIPMLQLTTDLSAEDHGQLRNRVDAFLELLAMRPAGSLR